jgi:myo-inositol-1(or 4)-monophosphatase
MAEFWSEILRFAETTTAEVGKQLLQQFGRTTASEKADGSLVTQSDRWADAELRRSIHAAFPEHGMLSEEVEHIFPDTNWCWIIDPIDGTTNYTHGIPIWAISLGLLYRGTPVFGYVHVPPLNYSFHGFWSSDPNQPNGAFLNGQPIHSSSADPSSNEFFSLCARSTAVLQQRVPCKIRMLGAATYNLLTVAMGTTLGAVEATPKIWDIAAVWVIVQAAGAVWLPLETEPFPLVAGQDYSQQSYPTLVVSRPERIETFLPLVAFLGSQTF